jgi:hypothetical protein
MATLKLPDTNADDNGPHAVIVVPSDQTALIMRIQGRWRLPRTMTESDGAEVGIGWIGSFGTAADALAALQAEFGD